MIKNSHIEGLGHQVLDVSLCHCFGILVHDAESRAKDASVQRSIESVGLFEIVDRLCIWFQMMTDVTVVVPQITIRAIADFISHLEIKL